MEKVRADKLREVKDGHDGTWVAHPALIPIAKEVRATITSWECVHVRPCTAGLLTSCGRLEQYRRHFWPAAAAGADGRQTAAMQTANPKQHPRRQQVFDEHMKTPNQIDRQRDDVQPDAEALLMVSVG